MKPKIKPGQLISFIERVMGNVNTGVKKAAEVYVEYYDEQHSVHRIVPAASVRMTQTEHGPMKFIISENV